MKHVVEHIPQCLTVDREIGPQGSSCKEGERLMSSVSITDLPIYAYECTSHDDQPAVAFIGKLPMVFKGPTPASAQIAADKWRREEVLRSKRAELAKQKRLSAMKAAREAKSNA